MLDLLYFNECGRMHLSDAEAGAAPLFQKNLVGMNDTGAFNILTCRISMMISVQFQILESMNETKL